MYNVKRFFLAVLYLIVLALIGGVINGIFGIQLGEPLYNVMLLVVFIFYGATKENVLTRFGLPRVKKLQA